MSEAERDPYVGEIFLDLDRRSFQRRIRVTGFKGGLGSIWPKVVRTFGREPRKRYSYVVISNAGQPDTVGRRGGISAKTLDRRYQKVSR